MATWDLSEETPKALAAFKIYLDMGFERSLEAVSRELGHTSPGTVANWSRRFHWGERVKAFEEVELDNVQGMRMRVMQQNQAQILMDAFVDYDRLLQAWRHFMDGLVENPEITASDIKKAIESRVLIDNMGRRVSGLPSIIRDKEEEDKPQLPQGKVLVLPGGTMKNIEEEFDTTEDEHYDDED